ncbi:protein adenylyltransferase SelO [Algirhabdus cladophorae]|uniref:protein adenylyltransferase SelO n=1 Tax=Algirhabdus cladophorae TaxID=3377108 RepID=UPI003B8461C4
MAQFDNSYARLPAQMFSQTAPTPVKAPELLAFNDALAAQLGLPKDAEIWAGNQPLEGSMPIAQVYAGHQFGHWNPQLGDGRAVLLGEVLDASGARFDVQLKGSGPTPYSRRGDGRAWLGPVLREYVVSEAMHHLAIPTTRALAATATGETVIREGLFPGAVITRVASSHIRVGTFQFFASQDDLEALQALTDHVIARHAPHATGPLELLQHVVQKQADLVAAWMSVGFIHGVMNTDNCSVPGLTIDYGPCAFMDRYNPRQVFSSIDQQGRYAYQNQPQIAAWNLAQFATALLPLMADREQAIETFTAAVNAFGPAFQAAWLARFGAKIGLTDATEDDLPMIEALLVLMAKDGADFTNAFRGLSGQAPQDQFTDQAAFGAWHEAWLARLGPFEAAKPIMDSANPAIIPRNHRIEQMITAAVEGDMAPFHRLGAALRTPFVASDGDLTRPPSDAEIVPATFCGT